MTVRTTAAPAITMPPPYPHPAAWPAGKLADLAGELARAPGHWLDKVRLSAESRWYERFRYADDHEIWLISWLPGQSTGFHDHGGSSGAFAVAFGDLAEEDLTGSRALRAGDVRAFGPDHVHHVFNTSAAPAVSVHAYSPPLTVMNRYDRTDAGLVRLAPEQAGQW